jgi:hypothetical protein
VKPAHKKPWIPKSWRLAMRAAGEEEARIRREAFREAVMEVTGEDINDWY